MLPRRMRRLLIYGARIGDLVILTPVMRQLAREGALELLARPWAQPLFAHEAWLSGLHTLAKPNDAPWQDWLRGRPRARLGAQLAARGFDEVLIFRGEGATLRRWLDGWRAALPLREVSFKGADGVTRHRREGCLEVLRQAGVSTDGYDPLPRLTVPENLLAAERARFASLGKNVIAVQAGSSLTHRWLRRRPNLKGLAPAQWAGLIARLISADETDAVVLMGSAPEGREARAIIAEVPPALRKNVHDLTGVIGLKTLPAAMAAAQAVLSVDTGTAHIAAAVGTPLLVLFGPTDPGVFAPSGPGAIEVLLGSAPCQFCHNTGAMARCRANVCLTGLSIDALYGGWTRLRARAAK